MTDVISYGLVAALVWSALLFAKERRLWLVGTLLAGGSAAALGIALEQAARLFPMEAWVLAILRIFGNLLLSALLALAFARLFRMKRSQSLVLFFRASGLFAVSVEACRMASQALCGAFSFGRLPAVAVSFLVLAVLLIFLEAETRRYTPKDMPEQQEDPVSENRFSVWLPRLAEGVVCVLVVIGLEAFGTADIDRSGAGPELVRLAFGMILCWLSRWFALCLQGYYAESRHVMDERQYRDEMQAFMNIIRSQRHDFNFHVQALAQMFGEGNVEECRKYVDFLQQDAIAVNTVLPVKDAAVAAVLNHFQILAGREGIVLNMDIQNDLSQVVTNVYETNKIISNLLQNAIDEVRNHADKSYGIRLYIFKRDQYAVIHVANQVEGRRTDPKEIDRMFLQGYTTKSGHEGVGLSSIKSLLVRRKGLITIKQEGKVIHFVVRIPIRFGEIEANEGSRSNEA